jgi:hypothetical protein
MLTYTGTFDRERMIKAARPYIPMHISKVDPTECEVPFCSQDKKQNGYIQFALLAGNWLFVNVRMGK